MERINENFGNIGWIIGKQLIYVTLVYIGVLIFTQDVNIALMMSVFYIIGLVVLTLYETIQRRAMGLTDRLRL